MNYNYKVTFVRDALIATVAVVGLYLLGEGVQFQPLQIPWYLLVVGFDVLEAVFGSAGQNYDVLFAAYLVGLGVVGGLVASLVRGQMGERIRRPDSARAALRLGVAGALAVVGVISLLFASVVLLGTSQLAPVLITGVTGLVMLGVAGWLAGVFDSRDGRTA